MGYAYVTLVTNADYALGALALARSLARTGTQHDLVVLATKGADDLEPLEREGCSIIRIEQLPFSEDFRIRHSRKAQHAAAPFTKGGKPIFHDPLDNFCKLRLWELEDFERVVFLDADTVVVRNIDKLFGYPEFSAAPNLYESLVDMHRLNSGVFVAQPSKARFDDMLGRLDSSNMFWRRTDQTFLETYFPDWHGLPYVFNVLQYVYFNMPQLWSWDSVRVVHYQYEKPWEHGHARSAQLRPLIDLWHAYLNGSSIPESVRETPQS